MQPHERQQFDLLLAMAVERFAERAIHRCGGQETALERLRADPQGEGIWLDEFVVALFNDFLLNTPAGACFILEALAKRKIPAPPAGSVETMLGAMARRAFGDLLAIKLEEALEQQISYGG